MNRFAYHKVANFVMRFDLSNMSDVLTWEGVVMGNGYYERPTSMYVLNNLKAGQTFVDVGANIGYYSLLASVVVGEGGKVYSFEVMPSTFKRLLSNIDLNHFRNISAYPLALWHKDSQLPLYISTESDGLSSLFPYSFKETIMAKATTFDSIFPSESVDLIKIDVEGSESNVLRGAKVALQQGRIGNIIVEWNPAIHRSITEWDSRFDLFRSVGKVFVINGTNAGVGYSLEGPVTSRKDLPIFSHNLLVRP